MAVTIWSGIGRGMSRDREDLGSVVGRGRVAHAPRARALQMASDCARRASPRSLIALCLAFGACLVASASAFGAVEGPRAHETTPSFSFPVTVGETTKSKSPKLSAIAVSRETGDVFVVEGELGTVQVFKPKKNGSGEVIGEEQAETVAIPQPIAVAVDNSSLPSSSDPSVGDVYVASSKGSIFKLTSAGVVIEKIKGVAPVAGLTVNASGDVFASETTGEIVELNNAAATAIVRRIPTELTPEGNEPRVRRGLALDSSGDFYIGNNGRASGFIQEDREQFVALNPESSLPGPKEYAILTKLGTSGEVLVPAVDREPQEGVAVNDTAGPEGDTAELNDLYVLNLAGAAGEKVSTVSEFAPAANPSEVGQLLQRWALPAASNNSEGAGIAFDPETGELFALDAASNQVDVYKYAPAGKPSVSGLSALSSSSEAGAWSLGAEVNADGADTHYHFEYGNASCAASACTSLGSSDLGSAYGPQHVSQQLTGLAPGLYYYRVVAENGFGTVDSSEATFTIATALSGLPDGRAWELVSPSDKNGSELEPISFEGGLIQTTESGSAITYLADGPFAGQTPEGSQSPQPTQELAVRGPEGWRSSDINTAATAANGVEPRSPREYRTFSSDLSRSIVESYSVSSEPFAQPPLAPKQTQQKTIYLRNDEPSSTAVAEAEGFERPAVTGEALEGEGFYEALVNDENAKVFVEHGGTLQFGGGHSGTPERGLEFEGATPDLKHAVFRSENDARGLYEWAGRGEPLKLVSVLPGPGAQNEPNGRLGLEAGARVTANAISSDGSRVIWSPASPGGTGHLYMRDTETEETIELDKPQTKGLEELAEKEPAEAKRAYFMTASTDGSKVFFIDGLRLTTDSHATKQSPDLYVYELNVLSPSLRDLTPQAGANVLLKEQSGRPVIGASEDGTYVYFVANGVLAPGASTGGCATKDVLRPGATCNVYMSHLQGKTWETTFVASLSQEDLPDWGNGEEPARVQFQTARVSPNGHYVAFMSNRNLTGYEPVEAGTGQRDEEVYLYEAATAEKPERLVCVSCNPNGAPPVGVFDPGGTTNGQNPEGIGLYVDRPQIWGKPGPDRWLAGNVPGWTAVSNTEAPYQSRYVANNGRVFFNSPDQLVPGVSGHKEMVYEHEPDNVGSCTNEGGCVALVSGGDSEREQAFVDASANGNDVFFLSAEPILTNPENNHSLYDAHVCEPASPCISASDTGTTQCDEEGQPCRPAPQPFTGAGGSLLSESTSGPGNLVPQLGKVQVLPTKTTSPPKPLTRAQKLAKALKACKKDKNKKKRVACEKQARKKYGKSAKKSSTSKSGTGAR